MRCKKSDLSFGKDEEVNRRGVTGLAVILVDMQPEFTRNIFRGVFARILKTQSRVIKECAELDVPIAVLEFEDCARTIQELRGLLRSVPRKRVFKKDNNDGFTNDALKGFLDLYEIDSVLFMGLYSNACVLSTAKSAVLSGFSVLTSEDLIAQEKSYIISDFVVGWFANNGIIYKKIPPISEIL